MNSLIILFPILCFIVSANEDPAESQLRPHEQIILIAAASKNGVPMTSRRRQRLMQTHIQMIRFAQIMRREYNNNNNNYGGSSDSLIRLYQQMLRNMSRAFDSAWRLTPATLRDELLSYVIDDEEYRKVVMNIIPTLVKTFLGTLSGN